MKKKIKSSLFFPKEISDFYSNLLFAKAGNPDGGEGGEGGSDGSGADDDPKTGEFDINFIPEDKRDAFEKYKQSLIDKGVNIGVGRAKTSAEKMQEKTINSWLKEQGLSKDQVEIAKSLLGKKDSLDKLLNIYGTDDVDEVLNMIEEAERDEMSEVESLQADLDKREATIADLKAQIEALQGGNDEKLQTLSQREKSLMSNIENLMINRTIRDLAISEGALDPDDVLPRIKSNLKLEENEGAFEVFVVDDQGHKRFDANGKPLSPKFLVKDFLSKRPHLMKSDFRGGAGGGGSEGAGASGSGNSGSLFTREQLKDPSFVQGHMDEINAAIRSGKLRI